MPTAEMWAPAKKKKIVGTAHTFFTKFLSAHNTHTPSRSLAHKKLISSNKKVVPPKLENCAHLNIINFKCGKFQKNLISVCYAVCYGMCYGVCYAT